MSNEQLRVAAFLAYLIAWLVFAIGAIASSLPRIRRQAASSFEISTPVIIGTLLQIGSAMTITLSLSSDPLRPRTLESIGTLVLAPLAAGLFLWAILSVSRHAETEKLETSGAYAWLRHPIYLAFLGMLVATGLLVSNGPRLVLAILIYVAGSEARIASEEKTLAGKYPAQYEQYRIRTHWRYLPGLR